jgi:predicted transglutaminase-like cysteine proteinase
MCRKLHYLLTLLFVCTVPGFASAQQSPFMRVYGPSQPPYGFVRFCENNAGYCASQKSEEKRLKTTPGRLSELDEINSAVNRAIAPATDQEIYGVNEYWTLPVEKGDCEDYALLKQKVLVARGWPLSALLLTVVYDERGDAHAVLTVRTAQGDFVLDNKRDDIRLWGKTGYHFVMRQSYLDPRVWVSVEVETATAK